MATVHETGVDDKGLLGFYQDYFNSFPIFLDEKWELYKAMGGKPIGFIGMLKALLHARKRLANKKIAFSKTVYKSKMPWMTGGVLVFNRAGDLVYILEERTGKELDVEQIRLAIQIARGEDVTETGQESSSSLQIPEESFSSQKS